MSSSSKTGLVALAIAFALIAAPRAVLAQRKRPTPEERQREEQAVAHYEKGQQHYNLGEFDAAITEYKAAYGLTSAPGLLFNIAQAFRLKKDYDQALFFYQTYLREDPEAENRADVEALITEVEKLRAAAVETRPVEPPVDPIREEGLGSKPPVETTDQGTMVVKANQVLVTGPGITDVEPERRYPGRTKKIIGLSAMGTGALLVGVGLYFGTKAADAGDRITELSDMRGQWTQDWEDTYQSGQNYETTEIITLTAGGAFLAGGIAFYLLGYLEDRAAARALEVSIVPTTGGAGMVVRCGF